MPDFIYLFRSSDEGRRKAMGTPEAAQQSLETWMAWIRGSKKAATSRTAVMSIPT